VVFPFLEPVPYFPQRVLLFISALLSHYTHTSLILVPPLTPSIPSLDRWLSGFFWKSCTMTCLHHSSFRRTQNCHGPLLLEISPFPPDFAPSASPPWPSHQSFPSSAVQLPPDMPVKFIFHFLFLSVSDDVRPFLESLFPRVLHECGRAAGPLGALVPSLLVSVL